VILGISALAPCNSNRIEKSQESETELTELSWANRREAEIAKKSFRYPLSGFRFSRISSQRLNPSTHQLLCGFAVDNSIRTNVLFCTMGRCLLGDDILQAGLRVMFRRGPLMKRRFHAENK
jgi:hypothetical protein